MQHLQITSKADPETQHCRAQCDSECQEHHLLPRLGKACVVSLPVSSATPNRKCFHLKLGACAQDPKFSPRPVSCLSVFVFMMA